VYLSRCIWENRSLFVYLRAGRGGFLSVIRTQWEKRGGKLNGRFFAAFFQIGLDIAEK
jgi:hypothetical protein